MYTLLYKPTFCTQHILETRMACANLLLFVPILVPILGKSQTRHPARAQAPLPLPHKFFDVKSFYKIPPLLPIVIATFR